MKEPRLLAVAILAATATAQPLAFPAGKWVVEGRGTELVCILSREFGDPAHPVGLAIRSSITGHLSVVVSFETDRLRRFLSTTATVTTLPAATVIRGERGFRYLPDVGREVIEVSLRAEQAQTFLAGLPEASALRIDIGDRGFLLSTPAAQSASAALSTCRHQLAQKVEIDPTALVRAPAGHLIDWVKPEDYPSDERKAPPDGHTVARLTIDPHGKPTACRAAMSSGRATWDEATCKALMARAAFGPNRSGAEQGERYAIVRVGWLAVPDRLIPIPEDDF